MRLQIFGDVVSLHRYEDTPIPELTVFTAEVGSPDRLACMLHPIKATFGLLLQAKLNKKSKTISYYVSRLKELAARNFGLMTFNIARMRYRLLCL